MLEFLADLHMVLSTSRMTFLSVAKLSLKEEVVIMGK